MFAGVIEIRPLASTDDHGTSEWDPNRYWHRISVSQDDFEIVDVTMRVTERNQLWWRHAWRLTIRNTGRKTLVLDATIEFQDADGFVIDTDDEYGLRVPVGNQETFTGSALVNLPSARNVRRINAKVRKTR